MMFVLLFCYLFAQRNKLTKCHASPAWTPGCNIFKDSAQGRSHRFPLLNMGFLLASRNVAHVSNFIVFWSIVVPFMCAHHAPAVACLPPHLRGRSRIVWFAENVCFCLFYLMVANSQVSLGLSEGWLSACPIRAAHHSEGAWGRQQSTGSIQFCLVL